MEEKVARIYLKIKMILTELNLDEKYIAFEYLTNIIMHYIITKDDSIANYKNAIKIIEEKFNVKYSRITIGVSNLLKGCNFNKIIDTQHLALSPSIHKKTVIIKNYILKNL